jgi:hypothetical protein
VRKVTAKEIRARELLWQANSLAVPVQAYRRDSSVRGEVRLLGETTVRKFKGDHLVPINDLLANGVVDLPPLAREALGRFTEAAKTI